LQVNLSSAKSTKCVQTRAVETEPGARACKQFWMAGAKNVWWWSGNLKFGFWLHSTILWGKQVVQIIRWFLLVDRPNHSGAGSGAKYF